MELQIKKQIKPDDKTTAVVSTINCELHVQV